jgi:lamin tail-like protein
MIDRALLGFTVSMGLILVGCGSDGTTSTGTSGAGGGAGGTGASSVTSSAVGTGGAMGTGGGSATTTAAGTTTTAGSSSSSGGGGTLGDHLLISEIGVAPAGGEFIEIYNPTAAAVDLTEYYLADNSGYFSIAQGKPWTPVTSNPGTDFLAQFPAGTMIAAGAVVVVATSAAYEMQFSKCPDFFLSTKPVTCANAPAKLMLSPTNGGIGDVAGLSNDREMAVLFHWAGAANTPVEDVDYVTWGVMFEDSTRVDKTGIAGYASDTVRASQKPAPAPLVNESIERCGPVLEAGEKSAGGNGITGHDETSEPLDTNFKAQPKPTPGVKNTCL